MALSPLDIHNKDFSLKLRGYDQDQVNDFLSQIIKDYSNLLKENEALNKQLKDSQEKIKYFTDLKDALNQSIIVAQEAADKVKKNADQEAKLIQQQAEKNSQDLLTNATDKSNRILSDASEKAKTITVQTEDLKRQTRVFRQRLQVMLESQLEVVKSPEWKELLASDPHATDILDEEEVEQESKDTSSQADAESASDSESALDNSGDDSLNSESASADDGNAYTEIIFPDDDQSAAPSDEDDDTQASDPDNQ